MPVAQRSCSSPRRYPDETHCIFLGAGGSSLWGKGLTCKYNCNDEVVEMQLAPPEDRCPGESVGWVKWLEIKWLEIKKIL